MNAMTLACALGGRRTGSHWMAPCPAHEDKSPSLSIRDTDDGKILVHCHAGCDQSVVIGDCDHEDCGIVPAIIAGGPP